MLNKINNIKYYDIILRIYFIKRIQNYYELFYNGNLLLKIMKFLNIEFSNINDLNLKVNLKIN